MQRKSLLIAVLFVLALFAGSALAADQQGNGAKTNNSKGQQQSQQNALAQAGMYQAKNLLGKKVVSQDGQDLGSIDNLVIGNDGRIQYIILSRGGGILGFGKTLVPVPWQSANLHMQNNQLVAMLAKKKLDNAPTFNGNDWAQFTQPRYEKQVNGYYGNPQPGQASMKR